MTKNVNLMPPGGVVMHMPIRSLTPTPTPSIAPETRPSSPNHPPSRGSPLRKKVRRNSFSDPTQIAPPPEPQARAERMRPRAGSLPADIETRSPPDARPTFEPLPQLLSAALDALSRKRKRSPEKTPSRRVDTQFLEQMTRADRGEHLSQPPLRFTVDAAVNRGLLVSHLRDIGRHHEADAIDKAVVEPVLAPPFIDEESKADYKKKLAEQKRSSNANLNLDGVSHGEANFKRIKKRRTSAKGASSLRMRTVDGRQVRSVAKTAHGASGMQGDEFFKATGSSKEHFLTVLAKQLSRGTPEEALAVATSIAPAMVSDPELRQEAIAMLSKLLSHQAAALPAPHRLKAAEQLAILHRQAGSPADQRLGAFGLAHDLAHECKQFALAQQMCQAMIDVCKTEGKTERLAKLKMQRASLMLDVLDAEIQQNASFNPRMKNLDAALKETTQSYEVVYRKVQTDLNFVAWVIKGDLAQKGLMDRDELCRRLGPANRMAASRMKPVLQWFEQTKASLVAQQQALVVASSRSRLPQLALPNLLQDLAVAARSTDPATHCKALWEAGRLAMLQKKPEKAARLVCCADFLKERMATDGWDEKSLPKQPHWYADLDNKLIEQIGDHTLTEGIVDTRDVAAELEALRHPVFSPNPPAASASQPP